MKKTLKICTTLLYFFAAVILFTISLSIMVWSVNQIILGVQNFNQSIEFVHVMLNLVGAVIISIAILDIGKYMIEEEVFRSKELREPSEARKTITKIMTIIAIAVSVEGLIYIFKAGTNDLTLLIYPASLILVSVFVIIGLGVYQKLSSSIEIKEEPIIKG